jgi:hypothetical protein
MKKASKVWLIGLLVLAGCVATMQVALPQTTSESPWVKVEMFSDPAVGSIVTAGAEIKYWGIASSTQTDQPVIENQMELIVDWGGGYITRGFTEIVKLFVNIGESSQSSVKIKCRIPKNSTYKAGSAKLNGTAFVPEFEADEKGTYFVKEIPAIPIGGSHRVDYSVIADPK